MNIKRVFLCAMVSSALVYGPAFAAETGTISFSGLITGSTCNVDVGGPGADATVVLPTVSADTLDAPTKTNGKTRFTLNLSGCTGGVNAGKSLFRGR